MTSSHYQTLQVDKSADAAAIKAAFRRLAKQLHPDRNPTDPTASARFQKVVAAYEVLIDAAKRAAYDIGAMPFATSAARDRQHQSVWEGTVARIEEAIECLGGLRQMGGHNTWVKEIHAWAFLRAQAEAYELQATLRAKSRETPQSLNESNSIRDRLDSFHSAMTMWASRRLFEIEGGIENPTVHEDRSRVSFIGNPDVAAVQARVEGQCRTFLNSRGGPKSNDFFIQAADPVCLNHQELTLGAQTRMSLTPALIRIKDLQLSLDGLLICAAFVKDQWMGRWTLDACDNAEFLLRAAIAAEIVGIQTIGYEIPASRRAEAEWVKTRADRRMFHTGGDSQARRLAQARWCSISQVNYQSFADERASEPFSIVNHLTVTGWRDLASPIDRLRRVFGTRRQRYLHSKLYNDYYL